MNYCKIMLIGSKLFTDRQTLASYRGARAPKNTQNYMTLISIDGTLCRVLPTQWNKSKIKIDKWRMISLWYMNNLLHSNWRKKMITHKLGLSCAKLRSAWFSYQLACYYPTFLHLPAILNFANSITDDLHKNSKNYSIVHISNSPFLRAQKWQIKKWQITTSNGFLRPWGKSGKTMS